ncbi:acetyl-CoA C-acyltransferase [Agarivorans sp. QJM3NY_29]|uniref:acetyl-CoA C-acyltransferase n=1 Tax=unclassified Agarivorans TaxID=2636026 RepID=UPI003D7C88F0
MKAVYLSHYQRTAFSRAHPKKSEVDTLAPIRGDTLLAQLIDHALIETAVNADKVDDLSLGCALSVKDQWSFGGRYPLYQSQLGDQCASRSIDQQCGSGISAIRSSALILASGAADIALAGGYENMTRIPMGPSLFQQGILTIPEHYADRYQMDVVMNMGLTAEALMKKTQCDRNTMDEFALSSHQRAANAQASGYLSQEILPIHTKHDSVFEQDANIRSDTSLSQLAALKPVFTENGHITAGNSSPLTSGAALMMLMTESALEEHHAQPLARIVACADRGTQPELMGQGVVPAIQRVLQMAKLKPEQIDCWEINEAFSIVPLYAMAQLGISHEQLNINGGAIALGHPLGASGIRLVGTLARTLHQQQARYGVAAACIGGGQGIAMLIERV